MIRTIYEKLCEWKLKANRKPLILSGARQVGKTWLLKEFGSREYDSLAYINCDETPEMKGLFADYDVSRLIRVFSALSGVSIRPGDTLLVLDEIQVIPEALGALKYFCENAPEYHIAVAGSLLGIGVHDGIGFPVGKVDEIALHPMSFEEFLLAMGEDVLAGQMSEHRWEELSALSHTFTELLRQYYYVGGMPAVVEDYALHRDVFSVRELQSRILSDYRRDFSKHIPGGLLTKVNMVWDSVPSQLAKENKKYIYSAIKKGARAKDFEDAIQWLIDAGLVLKVPRVNRIEKPLKFYEDFGAFKLFVLDLGLMGAMADVSAKDVLVNNKVFSEYKGAFTEQYVSQEISALGYRLYYYSKEASRLEIDFVLQKENIYPLEVKAEENVRSKSLKVVYEGNPKLMPCRFSMSDFRRQDWMVNVPLYLVQEWMRAAE